jgi:hypothetical protein
VNSLHLRISKSPELKAGWNTISRELTEWLKDLATSVEYTANKPDAEIGLSTRIIADLRRRIEGAIPEATIPAATKIVKLNPLPQNPR